MNELSPSERKKLHQECRLAMKALSSSLEASWVWISTAKLQKNESKRKFK
jgi:hypothetical protein